MATILKHIVTFKFYGYIHPLEQIQMESGKKLQWVNSNTFINGTDTNITIDGDNSINLDAATSISLTSTNINVTGNLNVNKWN